MRVDSQRHIDERDEGRCKMRVGDLVAGLATFRLGDHDATIA
jgi:hypothetical protein